jgi:hypothetical protein
VRALRALNVAVENVEKENSLDYEDRREKKAGPGASLGHFEEL